jgi:ribosomal protein L9
MKWFKKRREEKIKKAEEDLKRTQEEASKIDGQEFFIPFKIDKKNKPIGKDTILAVIKNHGFKDIKKSQIHLDCPINEIGEFKVRIKFKHNLEAEIKIITTPPEEESKEE